MKIYGPQIAKFCHICGRERQWYLGREEVESVCPFCENTIEPKIIQVYRCEDCGDWIEPKYLVPALGGGYMK